MARKTTLGKFIRRNRIKVQLTQLELAQQMGWTCAQFIHNIEKGKCNLPARHIPRLAKAIKVSQSELLELATGFLASRYTQEMTSHAQAD